ncbi:MAG: dTDP-4-dehydrorhamnose reductase [Bacteroidales bacterium]|nr:dTDP-4-dehydrorhamnose reductase [Bacteroidales bacterium]
MKKMLITGANGQLGNEIRTLTKKYSNFDFIFTDVAELDICDANAVECFVKDINPDYIINCAAYTDVDKAESDIDKCRKINRDAVANLANASNLCNAKMIHVSTDYVYSGTSSRPYTETDLTAPVSIYGITKLEGENILFENNPQSIVIRTAWLYSEFGNNFVKTMIRLGKEKESLGVIFDQIGTPTYALDLADTILKIADSENFIPGIYNFTNEGVCCWYDFALKIHELAGITNCHVNPIETSQYPTPATRPAYSVLNKKKIKDQYNISIPHWEYSLKLCVNNLLKDSL